MDGASGSVLASDLGISAYEKRADTKSEWMLERHFVDRWEDNV